VISLPRQNRWLSGKKAAEERTKQASAEQTSKQLVWRKERVGSNKGKTFYP
jgi:hypothetical protein